MLFRWEYIEDQKIDFNSEQLEKQENPRVVSVDLSKSLNFKATRMEIDEISKKLE